MILLCHQQDPQEATTGGRRERKEGRGRGRETQETGSWEGEKSKGRVPEKAGRIEEKAIGRGNEAPW